MSVSYKKLWHVLLDKNMKKIDLERASGITHYTMKKLVKDENVNTEAIGKICITLGCNADEIMEFFPDEQE